MTDTNLSNVKSNQSLQLIDSWEMSKELVTKLYGLGIIAWFAFSWLFGSIYLWLTDSSSAELDITGSSMVGGMLAFALILIIIPVHELFHGLFIKMFGAKPTYGVGIAHYIFPYAYATSKDKFLFQRRQFIIILLAPLFFISFIGIILMILFPVASKWLLPAIAANAAGAVADIWMARTLLRYPAHVMIADDKIGMMIYGKSSDKSLNVTTEGFINVFIRGFAYSLSALVIILSLLPVFLVVFNVSSFTIGPKDSIFTIFEFATSKSGGSFNFGGALLPSVMLSVFSGLIYSLFARSGVNTDNP